MTFKDFELLPSLLKTLIAYKISKPTEIQTRAIPALLKGRSVVGVSETGSGKTLAFALPILHLLKEMESPKSFTGPVANESLPRAAVIVPSRELGEQVARAFKLFTHDTRLRVRTVLGGTEMAVARKNVAGAFEVLVATPGRLIQLIDKKYVSLADVRLLVFDEADSMLDQGFLGDAKRIVGECPDDVQMALFSATVSEEVQALIDELFAGAEVIRSKGHHKTVATLTTRNRFIKDGKRFPVLQKILSEDYDGSTLLFTNTREQCDKLATEMTEAGYECVVYRGEMDKVERRANLKRFRDGKVKLLISTDLAARGLDVSHVGRVINYHLPKDMENYLHRAGRTARAGREGVVINFVTERDAPLVKRLEKTGGKPGR